MPDTTSPADLLACATAAARLAGDHALANIHRRQDANAITHHDVKLKLDVECQAIVESAVRATFPDHDILGEEDDHGHVAPPPADGSDLLWPTPSDNTLWVIDPIDGTVNFSHGLPLWCCSIGVLHNGRPIAGVVYAPALGELYAATCESPATRNGEPIHVSNTSAIREALVVTGVDRHKDKRVPPLSVFNAIAEHVQRPRIMGSAALDMCNVAAGRADGYVETGIFLWDVAAAALIVRQAGGQVETLQREPGFRLQCIATNGKIHADLKSIVLNALGR
ncbi:MAG: inositol monophosphatase [Lentisphaerae bacterium]|nr:inositol monophosphatase [Lentisphaerota bacterium]